MPKYTVTLKFSGEAVIALYADSPADAQDEAAHIIESTHVPTKIGGFLVHIYPQQVTKSTVEKGTKP
jgi:hypothetical protein